MKKLVCALAVALAASASLAHAQGTFGSGIELRTGTAGMLTLYANDNSGTTRLLPTGSTATLNQTSFGSSPGTTPTFNLGTFSNTASTTLNLRGFSLLTFGTGIASAQANYVIYTAGSRPATPTFTAVSLPNNETNVAGANGDKRFSTETLTTNLLAGLTPGNYEIEIYYQATDGTNIYYSSNNGPNFGATFTVTAVPEPSTWAMMILGGVGAVVVVRRRLA